MEIKSFNKGIKERIKQVRLAKNLTQQAFARSLGIAQGFLSELEKGLKRPSDTLLIALSHLYEINLNWLLTGEGEMFIEEKKAGSIKIEPNSVLEKIFLMLQDMDEEKQREILKYTEKEKLLTELLEEKKKKQAG